MNTGELLGSITERGAGLKAWHGASPNSAMTHISIVQLNGKAADWMEQVSDQQYQGELKEE